MYKRKKLAFYQDKVVVVVIIVIPTVKTTKINI